MPARWDDYELDARTRRLSGPDGDIHVEPQVFDVLALLIAERDRVVAKEEILEAVWGDQFVSESALTTRIKEARRAIGDDGRSQRYIRNSHGHGYQFVGELSAPPVRPDTGGGGGRLALDITVDDEFPFVGRVEEVETALSHLRAAGDHATQLFVGGAPGAGKSRLAIELLQRIEADGRIVAAGRCEERVTSALQPLRDAFGQLAAHHPDRVGAWAAGVEGPLVAMIPSLVEVLPFDAVPVDAYAGIDAFLTVLQRISAEQPLVLLIDDLQWSDDPTRGVLGRVARRLVGHPIAMVHTFRTGRTELPDEVERWLRDQSRDGSLRLDLAGLDPHAAESLIVSVLGDDADVETVVETTAGHCLFLTESLRDLQLGQSTARSVVELVTARVERQSPDVRSLITVAALLGAEFAFSVAAAAADLSPADALAAIDEAIEAELVHETASPERFRFSHQLVPQAIEGSLGRRDRALAHARCAEALGASGADATEVALHRLGAVPLVALADAVEGARAAAEAASADAEFDRAIRLLSRVLDMDLQTRTRAEVLVALGSATLNRGTCGAAVATFEEVADLARRNGWPDLLADAALGHWGRSPFRRLRDRSTLSLLREADEALGPEPSVRKARVQAKRAAFSLFTTRLAARQRMFAEAVALAPGLEGTERMEMLESEAVINSCPAGVDELDRIDPELEQLRTTQVSYFADAAAPETRLLMRARGAELRSVFTVDERLARTQPITDWRDAVGRSLIAAFEGRFDEAYDACDEGGAIGEPYWGESAPTLHALGLQFVDCVSGRWERSVDALSRLIAGGQAQVLVAPLAWALAVTGDSAGAHEVLGWLRPRYVERFGEHIVGGNALIALGELALLLDDEQLIDDSRRHLDPYADLVLGVPWACSLAAADTLSRLAERQGDVEAALVHRRRAVDSYEQLLAPALLERFS